MSVKVKFNNGFEIPLIGLGTALAKAQEVVKAVQHAIDVGYRHFDCAYLYENEEHVGAAIRNKIDQGTVKREDLFVTSKLWNTFHRPDLVEGALRKSLSDLGLEYLDLYLMHSPVAFKEGDELRPADAQGYPLLSDVDFVDTWKAMEKLVPLGLVKSIGVSNFNENQLQRILDVATIPPVNNQVVCNPYFNQKRLIEFCKSKNITVTSYSPLHGRNNPGAKPGDPELLEDERLKAIAVRYRKSVAQIVLRYQIQRGVIAIPKSVNKSRITENINVFDFELSHEDMNYIDTFDPTANYYYYTRDN